MALHVFTQEEFDTIPRDEYGWKICPTGDYTQIKNFPKQCVFGPCSVFGNSSVFGPCSVFGNSSVFGEWATFGSDSVLGSLCQLGNWSQLGDNCRLGDDCQFGDNIVLENGKVHGNVSMLKVSYIGSRKGTTYFWKHDNGIYVRCGCFAGDLAEFKQRLEKTHKNNPQYLKEYRGAIRYAEAVFGVEEPS